nr:hypothetical protein [uncultured Flavobacterium sp.]
MSTKKTTVVGNRSAITGKYVTSSYASKHPKTTVSISKRSS